MGDAKFVTNEIIANRKNMAMIATMLPRDLVVFISYNLRLCNGGKLFDDSPC